MPQRLALIGLWLCAFPHLAHAQGLGAASPNNAWYRETATFVQTLQDFARVSLTLVDFSSPEALTTSLGDGVAALRAGEEQDPGVRALLEQLAARPEAQAGRYTAGCMESWTTADIETLVPCFRANKDFLKAFENALTTLTPAIARAKADCTVCCCSTTSATLQKNKRGAAIKSSVPLFAVGVQGLLQSEDRRYLAGYVSTNLPNTLLSNLVNALFAGNELSEYLSDDISMDVLFVAAGDARGTVLTGLSAGLFYFPLPSRWGGRLSGFIRSIPDAMLDPVFLDQSSLIDSGKKGHTTFGVRIDAFKKPTLISDPVKIAAKVKMYERPATDTESLEGARKLNRWLVTKTTMSVAQRRRVIADWYASASFRLTPAEINSLFRGYGSHFPAPIDDALATDLGATPLPQTKKERLATAGEMIRRLDEATVNQDTAKAFIHAWNSQDKDRDPTPLTNSQLASVLSATTNLPSRPALLSHFTVSLEFSGGFVAQGSSVDVLKNIFSFQNPGFRSSGSWQVSLAVGYWFWTRS